MPRLRHRNELIVRALEKGTRQGLRREKEREGREGEPVYSSSGHSTDIAQNSSLLRKNTTSHRDLFLFTFIMAFIVNIQNYFVVYTVSHEQEPRDFSQ